MSDQTLVEYFGRQVKQFHDLNPTVTLRGKHQLVCTEQAVEGVLRDAFKLADLTGLKRAYSMLTRPQSTPHEERYWPTAFPRFAADPRKDLAHSYLRQLGVAITSYVKASFPELAAEDKLRRNRYNEILLASAPNPGQGSSGSSH